MRGNQARRRAAARPLGLLLGLALTLGCGRVSNPDGTGTIGGNGGGGNSGSSGSGNGSGSTSTAGRPGCDPRLYTDNPPVAAPLALLNDRQMSHVAAVFDEVSFGVSPWSAFYRAAPLASPQLVERQLELATRIARRLLADPAHFERVIGCDLEARGAEACLPDLIDFVLVRLFRGLAPDSTASELEGVYERGVEHGGDETSGLRAVLEVALQAPELMYRVELGQPSDERDGWLEPTPREMASRLSLLFWDRGPDDELLRAADAGELDRPEQLAAQARRLLRDPRARDVVRRFYEERLAIGFNDVVDLRAPELTPDIFAAMRQELGLFVEDATFGGAGGFEALFAPTTWVNAPLARFYGLPAVSGPAFERVNLDGARHAGILTQGGWLASIGAGYTSPTRRGLRISNAFLCREVPPEPEGLTVIEVNPEPTRTTRERLAAHVTDPVCHACHQMMDPYGLAQEHFDSVGRWRETEDGYPIDTAVQLPDGKTIDGSAELAQWLLDQPQTRECFVQNWRTFAFGPERVGAKDCEERELLQTFLEADEDVVELLVGLTQTKSFRYLGTER